MKAATKDFRQDLLKLIRYAQSRIETEDELLERAAVMDELMDMAESEDDIAMLLNRLKKVWELSSEYVAALGLKDA
jgi:uncharacterized protein YceH (UPF0502 family)